MPSSIYKKSAVIVPVFFKTFLFSSLLVVLTALTFMAFKDVSITPYPMLANIKNYLHPVADSSVSVHTNAVPAENFAISCPGN